VIKKSISLSLVAALAVLGVPAFAQQVHAPNTIWGQVPDAFGSRATAAALEDASGAHEALAPIADRRFVFRDVAPGQHTVVLRDGAGSPLGRSEVVGLRDGGVEEASFPAYKTPAAAAPGASHGVTTAGWITLCALGAGFTTQMVHHHKHRHHGHHDDGHASPSR
jgi:hypothetical protein